MASLVSTMPGYFSFDSPLTPKVDLTVGTRPHIFQTPSASASLQSSTASLTSSAYDHGRTRSRKRPRNDAQTTSDETSHFRLTHDLASMACDTPSALTPCQSPPPIANMAYRLAGGLDTPTTNAAASNKAWDCLDSSTQHDAQSRLIRGYDAMNQTSYFDPVVPPALAVERNGQPRLPKSPGIRDGLGNVIYRFAGVAGKVWQNWSNTFRGFYAGGGQGYEMEGPSNGLVNQQWQGVEQEKFWQMEVPSTPGGFPQEDYIADYMSLDHTSTPPRASKRSKRDADTSATWVMVGSTRSSRETSPSRLAPRKVPMHGSGKRATPKSLGRKPILPASRPSLSSFAGSPSIQSNRASYASPRSPITLSPKHDSPVNLEVQRHAARLRRKEAAEDANLKRFNQQLKAMIKEGKEALGTRIEIEEEELGESTRDGEDMFDPGRR